MLAIVAITGLLFLTVTNIAQADISIAEDGFEDHTSGPSGHGWLDDWTLEKDADFVDSDDPFAGQSHLRLKGKDAVATRSAEVVGESSLQLRLWARAEEFDDNDAVIEVSGDGSSYAEVHRWNEDDDEEPYTFFDFDLSTTGLSFASQLWVRFRILGDEKNDGELFIDQLELANSSGDPDPAPPNANPVTLDGRFGDWSGKANITDAFGDQAVSDRHDIATFYWANNIDQEVNYHLIERQTTDGQPFDGSNGQTKRTSYIVYIDTNNDGDYTDSADRRVVVSYVPKKNDSRVKVKVYPADSNSKISDSGWNDWGDSRSEGGLRVEFALDWNDLGIAFGGVIRMYAVSFTHSSNSPDIEDRAPDGNADIQWSPASVLGPWLLGGASVAGIAVIWFLSRRRRLWT